MKITPNVQRIIDQDNDLSNQIALVRKPFHHNWPSSHAFGTPEWHQDQRIQYEAHLKETEPQIKALQRQRQNILDLIRSLPREDASCLLSCYIWKCDGDGGYGQWPEPRDMESEDDDC